MKKMIMLLMAGLLLTGVAYAQQDPDDPGIQDSLIIGCLQDHVDSSNSYQFRFVQIYAVCDDSVFYYNLPLKWIAPLGGVTCGTGTTYNFPLNQWDDAYDTVIASQNYVRQFGFCNLAPESHNPPLFTNGQRVHGWSLRFIIAPNTRSQLIVLDTTWDDRSGSVAFTNELGEIEITPGVQRGFMSTGVVGADEPATQIPAEFALMQNYPNPFNPETNIEFMLPKEQDVYLSVYNLLGQQVRTLVNARVEAGRHVAHWDGKNDNGTVVPSGVYFYRLYTPEFSQTNKMVMVR
ncbi:MAG: hypothetical protein A2W25_02890 [candidate division Zixibacteria bacterium RBG_16_53_22]|nr:MAG: hypothetical protein A2W25_02890 [candidate division Zixibacteria bacterium RBG_16_53_22]